MGIGLREEAEAFLSDHIEEVRVPKRDHHQEPNQGNTVQSSGSWKVYDYRLVKLRFLMLRV